jgi:hypothetical protein
LKLQLLDSKIPISRVIGAEMKNEVLVETDRLSGQAARGTKEWLRCYNPAIKNVQEKLEDEELKRLANVRQKWMEEGLPPEVQRQ